MRPILYAGLTTLFVGFAATGVSAQTAGKTTLGVAAAELAEVVQGWSVRRQLLGEPVYNDKDQKVGKIEDVIINRDRAATYAIIGAGGFLGLGSHDVAIPTGQFRMTADRLVLPGATKEQLEAMPKFTYTPR
jgi:hypothetical protein